MRRLAPILTSILLGALAVALGMGIFLKKANDDRERLADIANHAQVQAQTAVSDRDKAVQEANVKLKEASDEVAKAEQLIKALQEERDTMAHAELLTAPRSSLLRGWSDIINIQIGVSVKIPAGNHTVSNDAQSLTIALGSTGTADFWNSSDQRWLSITPYDERLEKELFNALATSTSISYVVQDVLISGRVGSLPSKTDRIFILRVRRHGETLHLIWGRDPQNREDGRTLLQVLSTLNIRK